MYIFQSVILIFQPTFLLFSTFRSCFYLSPRRQFQKKKTTIPTFPRLNTRFTRNLQGRWQHQICGILTGRRFESWVVGGPLESSHLPPANPAGDVFWDGEFTWPFSMVKWPFSMAKWPFLGWLSDLQRSGDEVWSRRLNHLHFAAPLAAKFQRRLRLAWSLSKIIWTDFPPQLFLSVWEKKRYIHPIPLYWSYNPYRPTNLVLWNP